MAKTRSRLCAFGLSDELKVTCDELGLSPARVLVEHQDRFTLATENEDRDCFLTGKQIALAKTNKDRPVVGDWVGINSNSLISKVLPRQSVFRRKSPERRPRPQNVAANVDTIFILTSCNREFSVRRLERYLAATLDSGAKPVVILTKTDLCSSLKKYLDAVADIGLNLDVIPISNVNDTTTDALTPYLAQHKTVAMVGSSGVGKSTLGNRLLEENRLQTGAIRSFDDKGRHTTTRRELMVLPHDRGIIIDTPGMREMALWLDATSLNRAFPDVARQSEHCRFRDCAHEDDLGCALHPPEIKAARIESYRRLKRECLDRNEL